MFGSCKLLVFVWLFCFSGCDSSDNAYKTISTEEFSKLIQDKNVQRLDVRKLEEFNEGHIPGSLHIDVLKDDFESLAESRLDKNKPVALYCRSGKRSKQASSVLSKKGFQVYELDGGFLAWEKAGLEIDKTVISLPEREGE